MEHSQHEMAALEGEHRLTEAELVMLHHALDSEMLGLKKALHYVDELADENAKHLLRELADIHHRRFDILISLLDSPGDITKRAKLLLQTAEMQGRALHGGR